MLGKLSERPPEEDQSFLGHSVKGKQYGDQILPTDWSELGLTGSGLFSQQELELM